MSGYGELQTLVICLDQLLTSEFHSYINLRNKITEEIAVFLIFIFLDGKKLHHLIFLSILHIISSVINYGCLDSMYPSIYFLFNLGHYVEPRISQSSTSTYVQGRLLGDLSTSWCILSKLTCTREHLFLDNESIKILVVVLATMENLGTFHHKVFLANCFVVEKRNSKPNPFWVA